MPENTVQSEDGVIFGEGDFVFNYYDMVPCIVGTIDSEGWFETWSTDQEMARGAILNGERICSMEFAKKKGWIQ